MSHRLPPLNGLRAFEAAARHKSFKRAADEMGVTAGAVSQQVKALEEALGIELFRRLPRAIALTADGRKYLPSISAAFAAISSATEQAAPALRGRKLRLGIAPALDKADCPALRRLASRKEAASVIGMRGHDDPALLSDGSLDAIIRPSIGTWRRPAYRTSDVANGKRRARGGRTGHAPRRLGMSPASRPGAAAES